MDLVDGMYDSSAMILPHQRYDLLGGEFRNPDHTRYLVNADEPWDADQAYAKAQYIHFSDWPVPKPWIEMPEGMSDEHRPPYSNR